MDYGDPEYLDEMERRGDSLLDEERHRGARRNVEYRITRVRHPSFPDGQAIQVKLRGATWTMSVDRAVLIAHAILSEAEIIQRGESDEW